MDTKMSDLPFEIKFTIFQFLDYEDLMTVTEVCREWLRIGTDSILWKNFTLVKKDHCLERICEILKIPRLKNTKKMQIWGNFENETIHHKNYLKNSFLTDAHFEVLSQTNLSQISFHNCILTGVQPMAFARLIR